MKSLSVATALAAGLAFACSTPDSAHAAEVTITTTYVACIGGVYHTYAYDVVHRYPWCVTPAAAYYAYNYAWTYAWKYPYVSYYPYYPYPRAGVAYGTAGAVVWGPYGGAAATTGIRTWSSGDVQGVTGASAAYNPWTGNAAAGRTTAAYDAATGTSAIGQRGGAFNAYNGNYGYGERGAAYNERTGAAAAGSHGTFGNAVTGNEVQAGRGAVYNPNTGQAARVGGVHGENGGVARVNNQVYVGRNGNVQQVAKPRATGQRQRRALPRRGG